MLAKRLLSQSAIYGIASILVNGTGFLLLPIYTRSLNPENYGIISSIGIVSTLYTYFLGFGLSGSITRYYFELQEGRAWKTFLGTSSGFLIISGLAVTLLLSSFGEQLLDHVFKSVRFNPYIKYGIWIGYFGVFPLLPLALLQVQSKALIYRILTTLSFLLLTALMIYFVVMQKQNAIGALKAQLFSCFAMACVYLVILIKYGGFCFNFNNLMTSLSFGIPIMIYMLTGVLIELSSKYFIEKFTTLSDLGMYNLAQQYSSALVIIISAINMAWVPLFYESAKKESNKDQIKEFGNIFLAMIVTLGLGLSLFSKEILSVFASANYSTAYIVVPIIILSYIFGNGFWILIINPIAYVKKTIYLPVLTTITAVISIIFNILLIPKFGIFGAAFSLLLSYLILTIMGLYFANRFFPINYNYPKLIAIIFISITVFLLSLISHGSNGIIIIIYKIILLCFYAILLILFRIISWKRIMSIYSKVLFNNKNLS